jgi:hypothetical protein
MSLLPLTMLLHLHLPHLVALVLHLHLQICFHAANAAI